VTDTLGNYQLTVLTDVGPVENLPKEFELQQNYPNPFLTSTTIGYQLSTPRDVQITIYDILGREVKRFAPGNQQPGLYSLQWAAESDVSRRVATGVYFYRLQTKNGAEVKKMMYGMGEHGPSRSSQTFFQPAKPGEPPVPAFLPSGVFTVRVQSSDGTFPPIASIQFGSFEIHSDTTIDFTARTVNFFPAVVYVDSVLQHIRGFGGANILPWRPDMTESDVATVFGAGSGQIGLSILRLRVPYSQSEFAQQVITAQRAMSYGAIVMASPWTPPAWMKSSSNIVGGRLNDTSYASYALHLKSFVDFMASNGVPLYGISVQNEPDISVTYESCDWNAQEMLTFVRDNVSVIGTRIIVPESFNFQSQHIRRDTQRFTGVCTCCHYWRTYLWGRSHTLSSRNQQR
jgi:glucuronoarabinoxylan endo-1,4-beta-xylanase